MSCIVPNITLSLVQKDKIMRNLVIITGIFVAALLAACSATKTNTKIDTKKLPVDRVLYDSVLYMDSVLFTAFNTCQLEKFNSFFATGLEFYHDKGGLTNYAHTVDFMKSTCERNWKLRRELVADSSEVYPINNYGAVQIGSHRFYNTEKGPEVLGGTFKFIHLWQIKNGQWKITRIISYDH